MNELVIHTLDNNKLDVVDSRKVIDLMQVDSTIHVRCSIANG